MKTQYVILYKGVVVSSAEDKEDLLQTLFEHYVDSKAVRESQFGRHVSLAEADIEVYALTAESKRDFEQCALDWYHIANSD